MRVGMPAIGVATAESSRAYHFHVNQRYIAGHTASGGISDDIDKMPVFTKCREAGISED